VDNPNYKAKRALTLSKIEGKPYWQDWTHSSIHWFCTLDKCLDPNGELHDDGTNILARTRSLA